ncbi:MAG: metalloregulator ArsR/SmtB family transcription factor [Microthrixaceae bacterium]|nr:helix-turn-helix transcriptional regulator [Microthrixaceae bacterium]
MSIRHPENVDSACCDPAECCPDLVGSILDEDEALELAELLKALADPARLRLVSLISAAPGGEACACDLTEPLGRSQPTVSHHLGQLVAAGILEREQRGRWAWFRLRPQRLTALAGALVGPGAP